MRCLECRREMRPQKSQPDGRPRAARLDICDACWQRARRQGRLGDIPRANWRRDELLEDARWAGLDERLPLRPQFRAIAERLGCTWQALDRAYYRARQTSDAA